MQELRTLKKIKKLEMQVMKIRKRMLDEKHIFTLSDMNNLASTHKS